MSGSLSSITWSPDFGINVAIGMVPKDNWTAGTNLLFKRRRPRAVEVRDSFWI
ncbi:MAG: hypothetical protein CM1200mP18_19630 [Gammaproteobacteria bacterium]|nr:MAG: hypothetical protein CM1200mP18_19630 [Gammaproteobacteria bacterium]